MDDPEQARAYAEADFAEVNQGFVDRLRALFPDLQTGTIVDLGCGPADIALRIAGALPAARVIGVDASPAMLALGRAALGELAGAGERAAEVAQRVELLEGRIPDLPLPPGSAAAIVSNSLLHHLPDPAVLWREIGRLGAPGAPVLVMDLFRPVSELAARRIVEEAGCSDDPLLTRDFYNSLLAAFTLDEVRAQLRENGLADLESSVVSERHLLVWGRL